MIGRVGFAVRELYSGLQICSSLQNSLSFLNN